MKRFFELFKKNKYLRVVVFAILGATFGYLYYYFIGCQSGSCPITSKWYNSTLYGMVMGVILGFPSKK
ncbi:MAG TPA: DUF6132 family protein [Ignavibacteriales bacterium]|jgi:hypothetical protein|nr:DUF6132 family protein [Ignavibacteriales bacterium]